MLNALSGRVRLQPLALVVVALGAATLLMARPAAATKLNGLCNEATVDGSTQHSFGYGGACYQGSPNAIHLNLQIGYCHDYHYDC